MQSEDVSNQLPRRQWISRITSAVGFVVLLGVAFRVREFMALRSLWLDEVALYIQIKARPYGALLRYGVGGNQGAPAAYLLLTKLAIGNISIVEVATRLVAFVAGLGVVFTTAAVAVRSFKETFTRAVACLLIASSPILIHFSAEGKQYILDTFVTSLLVLTALRYEEKRCTLTTLLVLGAAAVWFSHSAPLVLCACGLVLMARAIRQRNYRHLYLLVAVASVWVVSFAVHASTNMCALFGNVALYRYWRSGLAPLDKGFFEVAKWFSTVWFDFLWFIFAPPHYRVGVDMRLDWWMNIWVVLLLGALVFGLIRLWRMGSVLAPYAIALFAVVFTISLSGLSPFSSRIILYLVPWILFCHAAFIGWGASTLSGRVAGPVLTAVSCLIIGAPSLTYSVSEFLSPRDKNDVKGVVSYLSKERRVEEPILVQDSDRIAFEVYARRNKLSAGDVVKVRWAVNALPVMKARLAKAIKASPTKSVWVVGAFRSYQVKEVLTYAESSCCTIVKRQDTPGSVAALVVLKEKGPARGPATVAAE